MSYINKPGKTRAWRKMVSRQQVSDVISHGSIVTTKTKAKEKPKQKKSLPTATR